MREKWKKKRSRRLRRKRRKMRARSSADSPIAYRATCHANGIFFLQSKRHYGCWACDLKVGMSRQTVPWRGRTTKHMHYSNLPLDKGIPPFGIASRPRFRSGKRGDSDYCPLVGVALWHLVCTNTTDDHNTSIVEDDFCAACVMKPEASFQLLSTEYLRQ